MKVDELVRLCEALVVGMSREEKAEFVVAVAGVVLLRAEYETKEVKRGAEQAVVTPLKKDVNQSKILVPAGTSCVCSACGKTAYSTVNDVFAEGMTGEEFLACFKPEPAAPLDLLTDEYGNEMVDCPLCKGDKTVAFITRKK